MNANDTYRDLLLEITVYRAVRIVCIIVLFEITLTGIVFGTLHHDFREGVLSEHADTDHKLNVSFVIIYISMAIMTSIVFITLIPNELKQNKDDLSTVIRRQVF